jgi:hypothetical protein
MSRYTSSNFLHIAFARPVTKFVTKQLDYLT